jgi:hypothetical protein
VKIAVAEAVVSAGERGSRTTNERFAAVVLNVQLFWETMVAETAKIEFPAARAEPADIVKSAIQKIKT